MKILWCWRCRMEVPMFDEAESELVGKLYLEGMHNVKVKERIPRFEALLTWHKKYTGIEFDEPNAIVHHFISMYGPPCEKCGKPYRTPKASFCAACGNKRNMNLK